jgi:hypothetical protein
LGRTPHIHQAELIEGTLFMSLDLGQVKLGMGRPSPIWRKEHHKRAEYEEQAQPS